MWIVLHFRNSNRGSIHSLCNPRKRNYSKNSNRIMLTAEIAIKTVITVCLIIVKESVIKLVITVCLIIVTETVVKMVVTQGQTICRSTDSKQ